MFINFKDKNVDGFIFGQMTATGYSKVLLLDHDDQDHGWRKGDLVFYDLSNDPCMRIEMLKKGAKTVRSGIGKIQTFDGLDQ